MLEHTSIHRGPLLDFFSFRVQRESEDDDVRRQHVLPANPIKFSFSAHRLRSLPTNQIFATAITSAEFGNPIVKIFAQFCRGDTLPSSVLHIRYSFLHGRPVISYITYILRVSVMLLAASSV